MGIPSGSSNSKAQTSLPGPCWGTPTHYRIHARSNHVGSRRITLLRVLHLAMSTAVEDRVVFLTLVTDHEGCGRFHLCMGEPIPLDSKRQCPVLSGPTRSTKTFLVPALF